MVCFSAATEADGAAGEHSQHPADKEREGDGSLCSGLLVLSVSRQTGNRAAGGAAESRWPPSAPTDQPQPGHRPLQREYLSETFADVSQL